MLSALQWLSPHALWLLVVIPLTLWLRARFARRAHPVPLPISAAIARASLAPVPQAPVAHVPVPQVPVPEALARTLPRGWRTSTRWLPNLLTSLGMTALILACARPVEPYPVPTEIEGIEILLCLDTSSSMANDDLAPGRSRLTVAVDAAARFVTARSHDRIGVLSFARYPDLRCPPTLDHDAVRTFLGGIQLVDAEGDEDLTGIGTAVGRAAQVLAPEEDIRPKPSSRIVILLTDGDETVAHGGAGQPVGQAIGSAPALPSEIGPRLAARLCQQLGVRVYVIAVGERNADGGALDTSEVAEMATIANGAFFSAPDATSLGRIYQRIDQLEVQEAPEPRVELRERFLPFLLAGCLLIALGQLLARTVWEVLP